MRYPVTILLALFCAACGSYSANLPSIKPYKMEIQQGNVVTSKMMMQLRPGMSKSQVRFIMGTPLLVDSFHADRWDYFYQMRKDGKIIEQRRVILEFDGDALARVRGDVIPAGTDTGAPAEAVKSEPKSIAKPKEKEKGWLDKLKFWGDDEEAAKSQAKPAEQTKPAEAAKPAAQTEKAPAAEKAQAAAPATESATEEPAQAESLPPLVDPAMQPKPDAVAPQAAEPQQTPAKPATKTPPKAEVKAAGDTASAKPKAQPEPKAMTAPEPPNDLPPEDSPDFFEKMLEKIGF